MALEIIIISALCVAAFLLSAKLIALKRRIRALSIQLDDCDATLIAAQLNGDELETVVKKINSKIAEEQKAKAQIRKEQDAIKQAIANISHDMRTPLTSVIGYLQLAERSAENDEQRANIRIALERAKHCCSLVDDFFELSVIDANGCDPVMEKIDVNELLCEMILANHPVFEAKRITPRFDYSKEPVYALADRKLLTRVIQNLLSNAVKYGYDSIDFSVVSSETVCISVANPIADNDLDTERLFDRFYRASKSRTDSGAGIGLYLCKQLLESMGGRISASVDSGSLTISVTLKLFHN